MSELNAMSWWHTLSESQRTEWKERVRRTGRRVGVISVAYRMYNRRLHNSGHRAQPAVPVLLALLAFTVLGSPAAHAARYWHARHMYHKMFSMEQALPNPRLTPGAVNPAVTQATIHSTICVRGYTRSIRPPEAYTERLKREQIREYGYKDHWLRDYREDHLIPLEVGGSPISPENLWPEPLHVVDGWGAHVKDHLEDRLNHLVCEGRLSLAVAQRAIATNWVAAYWKYVGPVPKKQRWQ